MTRPLNHLEAALLGMMIGRPLRTASGHNWLQHLAITMSMDSRGARSGSVKHRKAAAKSFVASLQLLSRPGLVQWFYLPEAAVFDRCQDYLPEGSLRSRDLFKEVFAGFRAEVVDVMAEVAPNLGRLRSCKDLSMIANVYLNSVESLPDGAGVFFVRDHDSGGYTDVVIHANASTGYDRYEGFGGALPEVADYYSTLLSNFEAGNLKLSKDEVLAVEDVLTMLMGDDPADRESRTSMDTTDVFEAAFNAPNHAASGM